jgi:ribosomal protein L7/L12
MTDQQLHISVTEITRRLKLVEAKVDFILKELKIEFVDDTQEPYMAQVNALAAQGKVLDAIRYYREQTGADLASAKAFVEGLPKPSK